MEAWSIDARQLAIREEISFRVQPYADVMDHTDVLHPEAQSYAQQVVSDSVEAAYGGKGRSLSELCLIMEEVSYVCPALAPFIEAGLLFAGSIAVGGSEAQKKAYLSAVANGAMGAFALTDQYAGSAPNRMTTCWRSDGNLGTISGTKRHITFIDLAEFFICFACEEESGGPISAFVLDAKNAGVTLQERSQWLGLRGHNSWQVQLKDAVPRERLGQTGSGISIALKVLTKTRISLSAGFIGLAKAALDHSIKFASTRRSGSCYLSGYQGVSFPIAEVFADIEGARQAVRSAALTADNGGDASVASATAKLLASKALMNAVNVCSATLGGESANMNDPSNRFLRDAHSWIAAQGTDNIQKIIIARQIFA